MISKLPRNVPWFTDEGLPTTEFANLIDDLIDEENGMQSNARLYSAKTATNSGNGTAVYTAPTTAQGSRGTVITGFQATDPAGVATFDAWIGATASASTLIVNDKKANADGDPADTATNALVGQLILPGESLFLEPSTAVIVFYISGNER